LSRGTKSTDPPGGKFKPVKLIPLGLLEIGDKNIRKRHVTADIEGLAHSMKTFGLQQPIVVQKRNGKYEIVVGQRRYYAAKQLGWPSIPARERETKLDEFQGKIVSFSENIQRRDLSPNDKADACSYLLKKLKTPRAVAEYLGTTEVTVRKWLKYAEVPEQLRELVEKNVITPFEATRLFQYASSVEKAVEIAQRMAKMKATKRFRGRVFVSLEETPNSSVDTILRRAEQVKYQKEIRFILPEKWALEIEKAAKRLRTSPGEIARDATIEWLQMLRY
jgi:ParB/RepB/Spo0J family partition protein